MTTSSDSFALSSSPLTETSDSLLVLPSALLLEEKEDPLSSLPENFSLPSRVPSPSTWEGNDNFSLPSSSEPPSFTSSLRLNSEEDSSTRLPSSNITPAAEFSPPSLGTEDNSTSLPLDWIEQKEKQAQWQTEEENQAQWADFFSQEEAPFFNQRLLDDVQASEQQADIKKDIVQAWSQTHHPELHSPLEDPEHWDDIREQLASRYSTPAEDASLYKTIKTAYGDFTRQKTAFESLIEEKKDARYAQALESTPLSALPPLESELPPAPERDSLTRLLWENAQSSLENAPSPPLQALESLEDLALPSLSQNEAFLASSLTEQVNFAHSSPPALASNTKSSLAPNPEPATPSPSEPLLESPAFAPSLPEASWPDVTSHSTPSSPLDLSLEEDLITQKAPELSALFKDMQEVTQRIADTESFYLPTPSASQAGVPGEMGLPLPFSPSQLAQNLSPLLQTAGRLTYLKDEEREALFKQLEKKIIAQHEASPQPTSTSGDIMRALSRSHLKPLYGAAHYFSTLATDAEENIARELGSLGIFSSYFKKREQAAIKRREALAHAERLRQIAQQRVAPLFAHEDGRGHKPQRHWSADIGVGLAEGFVPLALSVCARPALLAYAPTLIGNHYAESEARFMQAFAEGKLPHMTKNMARQSHHYRFLGAVASGSLQTLVEAGLPLHRLRPLFSQVPKLLPTLQKSQVALRPYIEQKAYSMSQSLGETYAQYQVDKEILGEQAQLDTQRLKKEWGDSTQNISEYIATLPFVLLSLGKIPLSKIRRKQGILEDPALEKYFEIPKEKLQAIQNETRPKVQAQELQKALEDSPYWSNPLAVVQKYRLLPALDKVLAPEAYSPEALSSPQLKKLLQKSALASPKNTPLLTQAHPALPELPSLKLPLPKGGESPLELAQLRWHAEGLRPTLTPVLHQEKLAWQLSLPEASFNQTKQYASPSDALMAWRGQVDKRTSRQRHYALHPENFLLAHLGVESDRAGQEILPLLKEEVRHAQSLVSQKLLFESNRGLIPHTLSPEALLAWEKEQKTTLLTHVLEDALLYRRGKSSEEIISHRLTNFWQKELETGRLSPSLAQDWIHVWNQRPRPRAEEKLPTLSPKASHPELAGQLSSLGLLAPTPQLSLLFPPSFSEPTRRHLQQLSHSSALSALIEKTDFYAQELEKVSLLAPKTGSHPAKASENEAFTRSLSHFLGLSLEEASPHLTSLPAEALLSAQQLIPPALSAQTQKSLLWLNDKGFSPLFSITDESSGKVAWLARYPNGELSSPHPSFLNAAHDWKVFSQNHLPEEMTLTGLESHAALLDHFYHQKGRAFSHLEAQTLPANIHPEEVLLSPAQAELRSEIYALHQSPIAPHSALLKGKTPFQAAGANYEHISPQGKVTHKIEIYDPYDPLALVEEHAEAMWRTHLQNKTFSLPEAEAFLRTLEKASGQNYLPRYNEHQSTALRYTGVIEGLSELTSEFSLLKAQEKELPLPLRRWISLVHTNSSPSAEHSALLSRSQNLEKALPSLTEQSPHFLPLLADSLGLNNPYQAERALLTGKNKAQEKAIALARSPERVFEFLSPTERVPFLKKLGSLLPDSSSLAPPKTTQELYKKASSLLRRSKKDIAQGTLLEETQKLQDLLRQSQKNTPQITDKGLVYKNKLFSEKSPHRPAGIPSSWTAHPLQAGTGLRYQNPNLPDESLLLMWGNPFAAQRVLQTPYVRHLQKSQYLNAQGQALSPSHPSTYLPLEEFRYRTSPTTNTLTPTKESFPVLELLSSPSTLKASLYKTPLGEYSSRRELLTQLELLEQSTQPTKTQKESFQQLQKSLKELLSDFGDTRPTTESLKTLSKKAQSLQQSLRETASPSPKSPQ